MSRKTDSYYYKNFISCTEYACEAAIMLDRVMSDFHPDQVSEILEEMHKIEHTADIKKHEMKSVLVKEFIAPIEREDILSLSQCIDEVTDKIEDVLLYVYMNNVQKIRPEAIEFTKAIIKCCHTLKELMEEFQDFKKSKKINDCLVRINDLEEEGDRLYIEAMRNLHLNEANPLEIMAWKQIFYYLEKCSDSCEDVADVVESVMMKNS